MPTGHISSLIAANTQHSITSQYKHTACMDVIAAAAWIDIVHVQLWGAWVAPAFSTAAAKARSLVEQSDKSAGVRDIRAYWSASAWLLPQLP